MNKILFYSASGRLIQSLYTLLLLTSHPGIAQGSKDINPLIFIESLPCEAGNPATPFYRIQIKTAIPGETLYLRECANGGNGNITDWNIFSANPNGKPKLIFASPVQQPLLLSNKLNGLPVIQDITCIHNGVDSTGEMKIVCDTGTFTFNGTYYPTRSNQIPTEWNSDTTAIEFLIRNSRKRLSLKEAHALAIKYKIEGKGTAAANIALSYSQTKSLSANWKSEEKSIFNDFGYLLSEECYLNEARVILEKVLEHDPNRPAALLNLADNLRYEDKLDSAKIIYVQYLETFKKSKTKGKPAWWAGFLSGQTGNPDNKKLPMPKNCAI